MGAGGIKSAREGSGFVPGGDDDGDEGFRARVRCGR